MTLMMSRRKKQKLFAVIGAILVTTWIIVNISGDSRWYRGVGMEAVQKLPTPSRSDIAAKKPGFISKVSVSKTSRVAKFLASEAQKIGQFGDDPVDAERRLKDFSDTLNSDDLKELAATAVNLKADGDERFLSSYLLGLADSAGAEATQDAIMNVATAKVPDLPSDSPLRAMELTIRAQALEGMARYTGDPGARSKLVDLIHQVKDPFLADRAQRVLYVVNHEGADGLPLQDTRALAKLLSR